MITQLLDRIKMLEEHLAHTSLRSASYIEALEKIKNGHRELIIWRDTAGVLQAKTQDAKDLAKKVLEET